MAGSPRRRLPDEVHLPSGRVVALDDRVARQASHLADSDPESIALGVAVLSAPGVVRAIEGGKLDVLDLPTRDVHVLRALLAYADVIHEPDGEYVCQNCDAPFHVAPSRLLEIAPFIDGELDDAELDAPFQYDKSHAIVAFRVRRERVKTCRLAPRTARESLPLWRAFDAPVLRITPAIVTAMGVVELGRERRARVIADALGSAPDRAFASIVDLLQDAHYPRRLVAIHRCGACGGRNDLDVPLRRDIARGKFSEIVASGRAFPSLDAFESRVRTIADEVYSERGVRNVDLFIDAGVPACDDGGDPLLGCYTPGGGGDMDVVHSPEVRLFYRSFEQEVRADPGFDLDTEIRETIDHELTHHLHHLAGDDPLDDEEREEIVHETTRHVGRAESTRRARTAFAGSLSGFFRTTWPVWLLVTLASLIAWYAETR